MVEKINHELTDSQLTINNLDLHTFKETHEVIKG